MDIFVHGEGAMPTEMIDDGMILGNLLYHGHCSIGISGSPKSSLVVK